MQAVSSCCCEKSNPLFKMQPSLVCMTEIGEDSAVQYLCQLSQKCDKCAVRVLQLYLFAVWWLHDSRSVYEFLLEPDGCKATNECQLRINVKCSNHYMSTYTGCAASSAPKHKARDRQRVLLSQRNTEFRKMLILVEILGENKSAPYNKNMTRSLCHEIACNICHESEFCQI